MPRRVRPALPPLLPPELTQAQCITRLVTRLVWTEAQSRVVLAGVPGLACHQVASVLGIALSTARAHYREAMTWVGAHHREEVTVLAVATLWQSILDDRSPGPAALPRLN